MKFETNKSSTFEIILKLNYSIDRTYELYVFRKDYHIGLKLSLDGKGIIVYNLGHGNVKFLNFLSNSLDDSLVYFGVAYDSVSKAVSIFRNGKNIKSFQIPSFSFSDKDLHLGYCGGSCGTQDFAGYLYAFKWSKVCRGEEYFKENWQRGRIHIKYFKKPYIC